MMALGDKECFRVIKQLDLGSVLSVMDRLPFIAVGGSSAEKYKCDVVLAAHFPLELRSLIHALDLGGHPARAVLRKLRPRQSIPPHVDQWMPQEANWRRFQIPLVSHPAIIMRWPDDGAELHLAPGWLYEVRFDRMHEVIHNADCARIHLQIDQVDATI
jgi:hypothetical protein